VRFSGSSTKACGNTPKLSPGFRLRSKAAAIDQRVGPRGSTENACSYASIAWALFFPSLRTRAPRQAIRRRCVRHDAHGFVHSRVSKFSTNWPDSGSSRVPPRSTITAPPSEVLATPKAEPPREQAFRAARPALGGAVAARRFQPAVSRAQTDQVAEVVVANSFSFCGETRRNLPVIQLLFRQAQNALDFVGLNLSVEPSNGMAGKLNRDLLSLSSAPLQ